MRIVTSLFLLVLFAGGWFATAAEHQPRDTARDTVAPGPAVYRHAEREPTALEAEAYAALKQQFTGDVLDAELHTLRELAESRVYLQFLEERFPAAAPIVMFEDVFDKVLPPKERYLPFFHAQFAVQTVEEIGDEEQVVAHRFASGYWMLNAYQRGADKHPRWRAGRHWRKLQMDMRSLLQPEARKMLEARLGISAEGRLGGPGTWGRIIQTFGPLMTLASVHLDEDVRWIKTLFEKHGQSDGMLWVAIQDPILFDRILYAFSTDKTFLKCLYDPREKSRTP